MTQPALILLPGMMCDARLFAPQIGAFEADYDVTVPEIGGHDTVQALAALVLDAAPRRFALAGLSMGGVVAMEILRQAPERVERLALMDTNPLAETQAVKARRGPQVDMACAGRLDSVMRDEMKPNYLVDGPNRDRVLDLCMEMALDLGPDVFVNQSLALRDRPDQTQVLASFQGPALVLCGREDALCPVSRHELMADLLPRADLVIVENAGHLPVLEQPDVTNTALRTWLLES